MFATRHAAIYKQPLFTVRKFDALKNEAPPLFICYSLINRAQILDLTEEVSFIRTLNEKGHTVYLVDWHYVKQSGVTVTYQDYTEHYLKQAVEETLHDSGLDRISVVGICQGGNLATSYALKYPATVSAIAFINTPFDFQTKNDALSNLIKKMQVQDFIDVTGDVPGKMLTQFFIALRPFQFIFKTVSNADGDVKRAFDSWLQQPPDVAGTTLLTYLKLGYLHNDFPQLVTKLDQESLEHPFLNIIAKDDHIVPFAASNALERLIIRHSIESCIVPGGHIGLFLDQKTRREICTRISSWTQKKDSADELRSQQPAGNDC